jgi:tellurite resistance protein TerA
MSMVKGANTAVPAARVRVELGWRAGPTVPAAAVSAMLLAAGTGRVRSDTDLVTAGSPAHPSGAVRHLGGGVGGGTDAVAVDLGRVGPETDRIVLAAVAGGRPFSGVPGLAVRVLDDATGAELARYESRDTTVETALVVGELYRRQGAWKFRAVGQGYSSGPDGLAADYGITAAALTAPPAGRADPSAPVTAPSLGAAAPRPVTPAAPAAPPAPTLPSVPRPASDAAAAAPAAPVRLSKVTLTKETPAVSLAKQGATSGVLRVNLSWRVRKQFQGWGAKLGRAVAVHGDLDLDLCALWELTDGRKGVVQALGNAFGSLRQPPFIHLDGDDRTGGTSGENLTVSLDHQHLFRRILIFVTIYEGARSFADLDATVTLRPQHGAPVDFTLGECTVPSTVCALALITNTGSELVVRREARFLVPERGVSPQRTVDHAYGWGMNWTPGRK